MTDASPSAPRGGPPSAKRRLAAALLVLSIAAVLCVFGGFSRSNDYLSALSVRFLPAPAPSDVVVVAIDTESLQADRSWPWSRVRYAALLDVLESAGARQAAFDLDFSSPGRGDAAFGEALGRAEMPVYAAVFRREYDAMPGVFAEMLPNPDLAALTPVSTTYIADADGLIRRYDDTAWFSFGGVPSMAFALAGLEPRGETLRVDLRRSFGDIPVYSFTDVEAGRVPPEALAGKTVIVGATAIELGDEFAVPAHGLRPGVLLNALAYEAAAAGDFPRTLSQGWGLAIGLLCAAAALIAWPRGGAILYVGGNVAVFALVTGAGLVLYGAFGLIAPLATAYAVHAACLAAAGLLTLDEYAGREFRSRMVQRDTAALMESVIARNTEGVVVIDHDGLIERVNEAARDMATDIPGADGATTAPDGRSVASAYPGLAPAIASAENGSARVTVAGGRTVDAHWSTVIRSKGAGRHERRKATRRNTVLLLHDVTPLIDAEARERTAREEHEKASAAKSALMMTMNHELRTPLNAVIGFSDLIRDEAFGEHSSPRYAEFASMAGDGGRRLLSIVDDLLQAARFQSGEAKADRTTLRLSEAVEAAMETPHAQSLTTAPRIAGSADSALSADPDMIILALSHLFGNTAKYAGPDTQVTVTTDAVGEDLVLIIADDGPGTGDEVDVAGLSDLFGQGDGSLTRRGEGCGLGLYLVRAVAEAHGGTLAIDGKDGFVVSLTLPGAAHPDVQTTRRREPQALCA